MQPRHQLLNQRSLLIRTARIGQVFYGSSPDFRRIGTFKEQVVSSLFSRVTQSASRNNLRIPPEDPVFGRQSVMHCKPCNERVLRNSFRKPNSFMAWNLWWLRLSEVPCLRSGENMMKTTILPLPKTNIVLVDKVMAPQSHNFLVNLHQDKSYVSSATISLHGPLQCGVYRDTKINATSFSCQIKQLTQGRPLIIPE